MTTGQIIYGVKLDLSQLPDVFGPGRIEPYKAPVGGIDNLGISSVDKFQVVGLGEFEIAFSGYVRVARSQPTGVEWQGTEVYTNLIEMCMIGESEETGPIIVSLNPQFLSTGQIRCPFEGDGPQAAKACRMAVGAEFNAPKLGMVLFNKEPIELTIDDVQSIPPAGAPGIGRIYEVLPLYDRKIPEGRPTAYLTALRFAMGVYLAPEELEGIRVRRDQILGSN